MDVAGMKDFRSGAEAYDRFMGRYSEALAPPFADFAGMAPGVRVLDVGCGPGALTTEAVHRTGAANVFACDPTPAFVAACRARQPAVEVRQAPAEECPFPDDAFDVTASQLVLHFVTDPARAAAEFVRVTHPGGVVVACVWDLASGMQLLRAFWDAALRVHPDAPDEARRLRFGRPGEIVELFRAAGMHALTETKLTVSSRYEDFDDLWSSFQAGVGPAGGYLATLDPDDRERVRAAMHAELGGPRGHFTLSATARAARGVV